MSAEKRQALLFPGQGLESRDIISFHQKLQAINEDLTRHSLGFTQDVLNERFGYDHFDIEAALKDGEDFQYGQTAFMQPLIFSLSLASFDAVGNDLSPEYVAGHSLGEYPALTVAKVIAPEDAIQLVAERGS